MNARPFLPLAAVLCLLYGCATDADKTAVGAAGSPAPVAGAPAAASMSGTPLSSPPIDVPVDIARSNSVESTMAKSPTSATEVAVPQPTATEIAPAIPPVAAPAGIPLPPASAPASTSTTAPTTAPAPEPAVAGPSMNTIPTPVPAGSAATPTPAANSTSPAVAAAPVAAAAPEPPRPDSANNLPRYFYGVLKARNDWTVSGPSSARYVLVDSHGLIIAIVDISRVLLPNPVASYLGKSVKIYGMAASAPSAPNTLITASLLQLN